VGKQRKEDANSTQLNLLSTSCFLLSPRLVESRQHLRSSCRLALAAPALHPRQPSPVPSALTPPPDFKIVSRLDGVPAIHDSVAYAQ
jgi:hypothetical protein